MYMNTAHTCIHVCNLCYTICIRYEYSDGKRRYVRVQKHWKEAYSDAIMCIYGTREFCNASTLEYVPYLDTVDSSQKQHRHYIIHTCTCTIYHISLCDFELKRSALARHYMQFSDF